MSTTQSGYPNDLDICPNCKSNGTTTALRDSKTKVIQGWCCWVCGADEVY